MRCFGLDNLFWVAFCKVGMKAEAIGRALTGTELPETDSNETTKPPKLVSGAKRPPRMAKDAG